MSMTAADRLLLVDADSAVREQLAVYLRRMREAVRRIVDGEDGEALHDLRVALRRLLSLERGFRRRIDTPLTDKLRRHLCALMSATGPVRDLEVQLAWIESQRPVVDMAASSLELFQSQLRRRRKRVRRQLAKNFPGLRSTLRRRLSRSVRHSPVSYPQVAADVIETQSHKLVEALSGHAWQQSVLGIHRMRIRVKRLRVVLAPWADIIPALAVSDRSLTRLQERFGRIHDLHALRQTLDRVTVAPASEEATMIAVVSTLARRAAVQERRARAALCTVDWSLRGLKLQQQLDVGVGSLRTRSINAAG